MFESFGFESTALRLLLSCAFLDLSLPVVLWDLEHEAALVLDGAEPVPDGDRPHAVVRDLDGPHAQPELARRLVALLLFAVGDGAVRDGDALVRAARDLAVVVEPSRRARVRLLVDWNAVRSRYKRLQVISRLCVISIRKPVALGTIHPT